MNSPQPLSTKTEIEGAEKPVQSVTRNSVEDSLLEAHCFLKNIGEWLASFGRSHNQLIKRSDATQGELSVAQQKIEGLLTRCKTTS